MKKISLVASSLLLCGISLNAQSLEEAIKGVDVSGYLTYEYEDNRFKDAGYVKNDLGESSAEHTWKAEATLKTPVMNNVAVALGLKYDTSNNVNHGKGNPANERGNGSFQGTGLGAGGDDPFKVSQFYAIVTPDSTNTTVMAGKMYLNTPLNDGEADRGTGIIVTNSDIPFTHLTFGAFDSWSLDDLSEDLPGKSIAKPMFAINALLGHETSLGNFGVDLWAFHADDTVDYSLYGMFSWSNSIFSAGLQYVYTKADDDMKSGVLNQLNGKNINANIKNMLADSNKYKDFDDRIQDKNDFLSLQVGVDFAELGAPVALNLGYILNTQDGFGVSLDDEGALQKIGNIWFSSDATQVNFSTPLAGAKTQEKDLDVMYAQVVYSPLENLTLGLDFVSGKNKVTTKLKDYAVLSDGKKDNTLKNRNDKYKFMEIAPNVTYAYNDKIEISAYYAFLKAEREGDVWKGADKKTETDSLNHNQFKVEATYSF